jgi:hypothetical protein
MATENAAKQRTLFALVTPSAEREAALERVFAKPLWEEDDLAVIFNVTVESIRHMKVRGEIPAVVQINLRTWRVHRDAFLAYFREQGTPKPRRGRPPRAGDANLGM